MMEGTLIGFDFGTRRIGVAVGETSTRIASPLLAIEAEANEARFEAIGRIVDEWQPAGFVVGRPRHADGGEHEIARLAEKFGRRLEALYRVPVRFVDETLTSATADAQLREQGVRARSRSQVDAMAATIILQSYLDGMARVTPPAPR